MNETPQKPSTPRSLHTPGPWTFYIEPQPNRCPIVGARGLMVCMLAHSVDEVDQKDTALANASLIAAGPELLDACKAAIAALDKRNRRISYALDSTEPQYAEINEVPEPSWAAPMRTAIAKAEGAPSVQEGTEKV